MFHRRLSNVFAAKLHAVAWTFIVLVLATECSPEIAASQCIINCNRGRASIGLRLLWHCGDRRTCCCAGKDTDDGLATLRRVVGEGYRKTDHFTMDCFGYAATIKDGKPDFSLYYGGSAYGFDRATRWLAIFKEGRPEILVQDRHLFVYLWDDYAGAMTYLEVVRPHPITWNDVDEAERAVIEQCPLAGYPRFDRCMVLPLLEGGIDRLFDGATEVFQQGTAKEQVDIFELGHPQWKVMIGLPQPVAKLDPSQYPRCFRVKKGDSDLAFAVNRSGIISAVVGTTVSEDVTMVPGNRVFVLKKNSGIVGAGQALESGEILRLELPTNSKRIGVADLKTSYRQSLKSEGIERLRSQLNSLEEESTNVLKRESVLKAEIAECVKNGKMAKELHDLRVQLDAVHDFEKRFEYIAPRLRSAISQFQEAGASSHP
jgi:hypothetical protein